MKLKEWRAYIASEKMNPVLHQLYGNKIEKIVTGMKKRCLYMRRPLEPRGIWLFFLRRAEPKSAATIRIISMDGFWPPP